jgi:hypothetical protein
MAREVNQRVFAGRSRKVEALSQPVTSFRREVAHGL